MNLFVYGTLMRGYGNNHLLRRSEFLGSALTKPHYNLIASGVPFMKEGTNHVLGEVYNVDDVTLRMCDRLEGHPDWYRRTTIELEFPIVEDVEAYLMPEELVHGRELPIFFNGRFAIQSFKEAH